MVNFLFGVRGGYSESRNVPVRSCSEAVLASGATVGSSTVGGSISSNPAVVLVAPSPTVKVMGKTKSSTLVFQGAFAGSTSRCSPRASTTHCSVGLCNSLFASVRWKGTGPPKE